MGFNFVQDTSGQWHHLLDVGGPNGTQYTCACDGPNGTPLTLTERDVQGVRMVELSSLPAETCEWCRALLPDWSRPYL
jgi:hypothetical protein